MKKLIFTLGSGFGFLLQIAGIFLLVRGAAKLALSNNLGMAIATIVIGLLSILAGFFVQRKTVLLREPSWVGLARADKMATYLFYVFVTVCVAYLILFFVPSFHP